VFDYGGFGSGVIRILVSLLNIYVWVVLIRVVISWFNLDPYNPIVQFLRSLTDPVLDAVRRILPRFLWSTGLDFTPLVLILLLQVAILFLESIRLPAAPL
jgi:YggT family protein